jgi:hypothetical protein
MRDYRSTRGEVQVGTDITKTLKATLILLLQEKGTLKINDPVSKYVEDELANCGAKLSPDAGANLIIGIGLLD